MHSNSSTGQEYTRHGAFILCAALGLVGCQSASHQTATVPGIEPAMRTVYLEQGWSEAERSRYYHLTQGAATLAVQYEEFLALEQPRFSFGEVPLFRDPDYLSRFGFLSSPKSEEHNPGNLPVGFAVDSDFVDLTTGKISKEVGFTCAACHTSQLEYRNIALRIDGGPAMVDIERFLRALSLSVFYTEHLPGRFARYARRLLGPNYSKEEAGELRVKLRKGLKKAVTRRKLLKERLKGSTQAGFGRLDAVGSLGTSVFGANIDPVNVEPQLAPVSYPPLWGTHWFNWVQYNASVRQPMARNAGEALGLRVGIDLTGPKEGRFRSTLNVENLFWMERLLAGEKPFEGGLRAPKWPSELFGNPDPIRVTRGEVLYREMCQACHLPPTHSDEFLDSRYWSEPNAAGERYLKLKTFPLDWVGTDRNHAVKMRERTVDASRAGISESRFDLALADLVGAVVERWYDDQKPPTSPEDRQKMNGYRKNQIRSELVYKARPLDGVWSTPPYLHNGSVPNLFLLLSPASERPKSFYVGSRQYDPINVGFLYEKKMRGGFKFRVDKRCNDPGVPQTDGNCNGGHEFRSGPLGNGVLGRALSPEERRDLIEFLKTL